MDISALSPLVGTFGIGAVFLWAWLDGMKRYDALIKQWREDVDTREAVMRKEAMDREARMVAAIEAGTSYVQGELQNVLKENSRAYFSSAAATQELCATMKELPCHRIRCGDVDHLVGRRAEDHK